MENKALNYFKGSGGGSGVIEKGSVTLLKFSRLSTIRKTVKPFCESDTESNFSDIEKVTENSTCKFIILVAVFSVTEFFTFAAITILAPFFPQEAEQKSASSSEYGIIIGTFEFSALVASILCIKITPRIPLKWMMMGGLGMLALGTLLFGLVIYLPSNEVFVVTSVTIRLLQGVGAGAIDVVSYMVVSMSAGQSVSMAVGVLEMAVGLGTTVGPAVGGVFYDMGGFQLPFMFLGFLIVVMLPLNLAVFPKVGMTSQGNITNVSDFLKSFEVWALIMTIVSGGATLGFLTGVLEPQLRQFDLTTSVDGLITITTGAVFAITTPLWGYLADKKYNSYFMMVTGSVLTMLGYAMLGPFPWIDVELKLWMLLVGQLFCGLGASALSICPFGLMLSIAKKVNGGNDIAAAALVSVIHITCSTAGNSLGPIVGGMFIDLTGFRFATFLLLVLTFLQTVIQCLTWYLRKTDLPEKV